MLSSHIISTVLKHDAKQTSYKIALLRAINDVVLAYPDLRHQEWDIAIPLRRLAEYWLAYYWPFVAPGKLILQGARARSSGVLRNDLAFRPELSALRLEWERAFGSSLASDGFVLIHELRLPRKRASYPKPLLEAYAATLRKITGSLRQPIQYAGPGEWSVFAKPKRLRELNNVVPIPGAENREACLVVSAKLWRTFQEVSLWVEALCIHEWSLFTEGVSQAGGVSFSRGDTYTLLTERPDNRRPLTWERNGVDLLMMEGYAFTCPWTHKKLRPRAYDLDHLVPVSVYPTNELWNLVPADPYFNSHVKRARLPQQAKLLAARPYLQSTYDTYGKSDTLASALKEDVRLRFSLNQHPSTPPIIADAVVDLIGIITRSRNLATF